MLLNIMFPFFLCSFDESSSKIKEGGVFAGPSTPGRFSYRLLYIDQILLDMLVAYDSINHRHVFYRILYRVSHGDLARGESLTLRVISTNSEKV